MKQISNNTTAKITIDSDSVAKYKFVSELYDYDKNTLIGTMEDCYYLYDNPITTDSSGEGDSENINDITQFNVMLDSYCMYASKKTNEVTATCELLYNFKHNADITVKSFVFDGETELVSNEQVISISKENTSVNFELLKIVDLDISSERIYTFKAEIYDIEGNFKGKKSAELKIDLRLN